MTCVANRARNHNKARHPSDALRNELSRDSTCDSEPGERLVCNEQLGRLAEALDRLPYEQREILMLHMYSGLFLRAIGKTQGFSPNTVMSRYRYGMNKLRSLLNGDGSHET